MQPTCWYCCDFVISVNKFFNSYFIAWTRGKLCQHKSVNPWKSNGICLCQVTWLTILRKIWSVKLIRREEFQGHEVLMKVTVGLHNMLWKYSIRDQKNSSSAVYLVCLNCTQKLLRGVWIKSLKDLRLEIALTKRIIVKLLRHSLKELVSGYTLRIMSNSC